MPPTSPTSPLGPRADQPPSFLSNLSKIGPAFIGDRTRILCLGALSFFGCADDYNSRNWAPFPGVVPAASYPNYQESDDVPEQEAPDESLTPENIDERFERRVSKDLNEALDSSKHMDSFFINSVGDEEWESIIQDLPFGFRGSNINISIKIYEDERRGAKDHYLDFDSNRRLKIVWINDPTRLGEQKEKVFQIIKRAILSPEFQESVDYLDFDLYSFFSDDEKKVLSQFDILDKESLDRATNSLTYGSGVVKDWFTFGELRTDIEVTGTFSKDLFDRLPKGEKGMLMHQLMYSGLALNIINLHGFDYVKSWHMSNGFNEEEFYLSMAKANPTYIFSQFDSYRDKVWAEEVLQAAMYGVSFATVKAQLEDMDLSNEFKEKLSTENGKREEGGIILERYKMGDIDGSFLRNELIHASPQVQFSILYQEAISNSFFIFSVTNMDIYKITFEQREQILLTALSHAARSRENNKYFEREILTPIRRKYGQEIIDKTYRQLEKDQKIASALLWRQPEKGGKKGDIEALMKDPALVGISLISLDALGDKLLSQLDVFDGIRKKNPSDEDKFLIADLKAMISRSLYLMRRPINADNIKMAAETIFEAGQFYENHNMYANTKVVSVAQPERHETIDCGDDCTEEQFGWNRRFEEGGMFHENPYRFGRDEKINGIEDLNPKALHFRARVDDNSSAKRVLRKVLREIRNSHGPLLLEADGHIRDIDPSKGVREMLLSTDGRVGLDRREFGAAYGKHLERRSHTIEGSGVRDPDYLMTTGCFGHNFLRELNRTVRMKWPDKPMSVIIAQAEYSQIGHSEFHSPFGDILFEKLFNAGEVSGTLGTLITGDSNSGTANATIYVPWKVKNPVTDEDEWTLVQVR